MRRDRMILLALIVSVKYVVLFVAVQAILGEWASVQGWIIVLGIGVLALLTGLVLAQTRGLLRRREE
jgi:hypothetical protein